MVPAVQPFEIRHAIRTAHDGLTVNGRRAHLERGRCLDDQRIARGPVEAAAGDEAHLVADLPRISDPILTSWTHCGPDGAALERIGILG